SSGIGASIAIELAKQGADVVIDYHAHPQGAEAVAKEIASAGSKSLIVQADVGRVQDIQRLIDATVKQFGKIDILVNNAGVETRTSILDTTEDQFDKVMHVNLKSAFFSMQMAAKQMIQKKIKGRIINISSVHEEWPMPYNTAYCLSKGGLKMLTRTSALELAKYGILAVNVAPGAIATPINLSTMKDPALLQKLNAAIPLGRMGKPEEIASVVAFLAGDGGSYITSTTIFVDGGIMHQSSGL
ncbi:MAG: SDR family oxidoreductase, partial [Chlamydiae bacterium]|nr:SDR family oxidoreductase [Chlamydiota bacterium]